VACGDWARIVTPAVLEFKTTEKSRNLPVGILLDPPYENHEAVYSENQAGLSADVVKWAIENGDDKRLRIAVCGYDGEHEFDDRWECVEWKASGGYGNQSKAGNDNKHKERIWFSPHCVKQSVQLGLFD